MGIKYGIGIHLSILQWMIMMHMEVYGGISTLEHMTGCIQMHFILMRKKVLFMFHIAIYQGLVK